MKKTIIALALISLGLSSLAQEGVKIGNDVSPPDQSAMFEVESSSKGVLFPRVEIDNLNTALPVTNPEVSLIVYNNSSQTTNGFYYWNGTKWVSLGSDNFIPKMTYDELLIFAGSLPSGMSPCMTDDRLGMLVFVISLDHPSLTISPRGLWSWYSDCSTAIGGSGMNQWKKIQ